MSFDNVANYNPIASLYTSFASKREMETIALEKLLLSYLPKEAHILDIGCANGRLIKELNMIGYQTTGIDISEELLRIARLNVPESKFILGDIRELELQPIYDGVISCDVFSHILNLEELTTVFRKVYAAMHDNGIFGFITPIADEIWQKRLDGNRADFKRLNKIHVTDTCVYSERVYNYNEEEKIREVKFNGFELIDGVWQRSDISMLVKDYFESDIKSALVNVGFIEVGKFDNRDFDGLPSCFICRKPCVSQ